MILDYQGKTPNVEKALFIADNASVIGDVTLAENTNIWFGAVLRGDEVVIGENVTIGHNCIIHGCTIGDGTLVGMGAIILNHAVIGKDCIVGAGAVVTEGKVFPDRSLIVGCPAVVKKEVTAEQLIASAENIQTYVEAARIYGESR